MIYCMYTYYFDATYKYIHTYFSQYNSHYYNLAVVLSGAQLWNDSIISSHDMEGTYGGHR